VITVAVPPASDITITSHARSERVMNLTVAGFTPKLDFGQECPI
jgi:hypothetical protein